MDGQSASGFAWWSDSQGSNVENLFSIVQRLESKNLQRIQMLRACETIYEQTDLGTEFMGLFGLGAQPNSIPLARSLHDTLYNRFAKNRPKPEILPLAGDWDAQNKAKLGTQWLQAMYARNRVYEQVLPNFVYDGLMYGTGAIHVHDEGSCGIQYDRTFVGDLLVHPKEERNFKFLTLYKSIGVDKSVLRATFGQAGIINRSNPRAFPNATVETDLDELSDDVHLVEAWRLPVEKDEKGEWVGGKHVICVSGGMLHAEPWDVNEFPFIFWNFRPRPRKVFGMGIVESVMAAHLSTNDVANMIDDAVEAMTPKIMCQPNSIPVKQVNNEIGGIWVIKGTKPEIWSPPPVNEQVMEREEQMLTRAYRFEGVSEQDAMMVRPAGIESGIAQQVYHDIGSTRYAVPAQALDDAIAVALARHTIRLAEKSVKDPKKSRHLQVLGPGTDEYFVEAISYKDARIDEGKYILRVFPVSTMPDTPTGKINYVDKLRQMQVFTDPIQIRRMLDLPDLARENQLDFAGFEIVDRIIAAHMRQMPWDQIPKLSTYMPQAYMIDRITKHRDMAQLHNAPQDVLDRLGALLGFAISMPGSVPAGQPPAEMQAPNSAPALPAGPPQLPV